MGSEYQLYLKDEKALIKGCIDNDRVFQNHLYKLFAAKMMGVCMRYARTKEDAEDILQEGFIQTFSHLHQFKFKGSLFAWMKRIFINCALQKLREKESNLSFVDIQYMPEKHEPDFQQEGMYDMKKILACIQNLPLVSRLVFNLYVFEGYKHKDIARMLNISEGTSKSNLFDARLNLKKQLQGLDIFIIKTANG